jgi:hypothetical protein
MVILPLNLLVVVSSLVMRKFVLGLLVLSLAQPDVAWMSVLP